MSFNLNDPYYTISGKRAESFNNELKRELPSGHMLDKEEFNAIATRDDNDDVLFYIKSLDNYAIVHLTWSCEENPSYPRTELFNTIEDVNKYIILECNE